MQSQAAKELTVGRVAEDDMIRALVLTAKKEAEKGGGAFKAEEDPFMADIHRGEAAKLEENAGDISYVLVCCFLLISEVGEKLKGIIVYYC